MKYIFDSDALIALTHSTREDHPLILDFLETLEDASFSLSILTIYEYEFGIAGMTNKEEKEKEKDVLKKVINWFEVMPLSLKDAKVYGELKQGFRQKTGINQNALKRHNIDIALARVAIANDVILISQDGIYTNHLQEINSQLQCQPWK